MLFDVLVRCSFSMLSCEVVSKTGRRSFFLLFDELKNFEWYFANMVMKRLFDRGSYEADSSYARKRLKQNRKFFKVDQYDQ